MRSSIVSDSSISLTTSLIKTDAAKSSADRAVFDNVVCSMVISYKAVGKSASIKRKSINKQAAKNDCKGVSGSIIICPVLGGFEGGAEDVFCCSTIFARYDIDYQIVNIIDREDNAHTEGKVRSDNK